MGVKGNAEPIVEQPTEVKRPATEVRHPVGSDAAVIFPRKVDEAVTKIPSPYKGTCVPTFVLSQGTVAADAKEIHKNETTTASNM